MTETYLYGIQQFTKHQLHENFQIPIAIFKNMLNCAQLVSFRYCWRSPSSLLLIFACQTQKSTCVQKNQQGGDLHCSLSETVNVGQALCLYDRHRTMRTVCKGLQLPFFCRYCMFKCTQGVVAASANAIDSPCIETVAYFDVIRTSKIFDNTDHYALLHSLAAVKSQISAGHRVVAQPGSILKNSRSFLNSTLNSLARAQKSFIMA